MAHRTLKIGETARLAGISADTLRYYERVGVLPRCARTPAGYREYSEAAVARVRFVRNAVTFGFSLRQIASFIRARESGATPCQDVRRAGQRILEEMDREIEALRLARAAVGDVLKEWDERLNRTSPGARAHLLEMLPTANAAAADAGSRTSTSRAARWRSRRS